MQSLAQRTCCPSDSSASCSPVKVFLRDLSQNSCPKVFWYETLASLAAFPFRWCNVFADLPDLFFTFFSGSCDNLKHLYDPCSDSASQKRVCFRTAPSGGVYHRVSGVLPVAKVSEVSVLQAAVVSYFCC